MFPIYNVMGRVVALGGRLLNNLPEAPKYLNSPETTIYKKGTLLYGLHLAKQAIRAEGRVLVEGYLDLISLFQSGIEHVVATLGTALTRSHVQLLKAYAKEAVLLFDGDAAGRSAALRGKEYFLQACALFPAERSCLVPAGGTGRGSACQSGAATPGS